MRFSIVIPTYNRANLIGKTIQFILKQTYTNFEIIVVDDGSTDHTKSVVQTIEDSRIFYYKKKNEERGKARNFGANKATGAYINFFDSDDLAYDNHLQVAYNTIKKNNNPELFHLGYDIKALDGKIIQVKPIKNINTQLANGNILSFNGVFIRRDVALKHPFNENRLFCRGEDYFHWLHLASQYTILHNNTITSTMIQHDNRSVLSINKRGITQSHDVFRKLVLGDKGICQYYGKKIKKIISDSYSYVALHLVLSGYKKDGIKYLKKSLCFDLTFIFKRRFLAIIKHLIR